MAGSGSSRPKLPPVAAPIPTPEDIDVQAMRKGEDLRKKLRARAGRRGTILTEGTLGEPLLQKQTLLGRSA